MDTVWSKIAVEKIFCNDFVEEFGRSICGNCVQCPAKDIVVEVVPRDFRTDEAVQSNVIEEVGEEVKSSFDKSQTLLDHERDDI